MSQRLQDTTKWIWCFFVIYSGSVWKPVNSVTMRAPPKNPTTIEAQAKFFQDFFSVQLSPYKIEFGHVCEDPNTWEQRYEKKDFKNHRDMGKVRWGDKKGGYGEHYWDLNHAGHANDHNNGYNDGSDDGSDDGSYHEDSRDTYDEPSDHSPRYGTEEYNFEPSDHEENGRAKRAHARHTVKTRKTEKVYDEDQEEKQHKPEQKVTQKNTEKVQETDIEDENVTEKIEKKNTKPRRPNVKPEESQKPKEKNDFVLVIDHKDKEETKEKETVQEAEQKHFVPYENGAGVRQHYQAQVAASTTVPRLFLEPSTGHVVDRATGQAYVLQPVRIPIYN